MEILYGVLDSAILRTEEDVRLAGRAWRSSVRNTAPSQDEEQWARVPGDSLSVTEAPSIAPPRRTS